MQCSVVQYGTVRSLAPSPFFNSSIDATGCIHITMSSTPHQSTTTHYNTLHYTTLHYTTLHSAHITSDFSMRIAKLSMRDRAWMFFESIPCKPPRAMDNPLELNTPVVMWKRKDECVCVCVIVCVEMRRDRERVCV